MENNMGSNGSVTFSNEALLNIIKVSLSDVEGLVFQSSNIVDGVSDFFTGKKTSKGLQAYIQDGKVYADLSIVVKFGVNVPNLCENIYHNITKAVQTMTDLEVAEINVSVVNVTVDEQKNTDN